MFRSQAEADLDRQALASKQIDDRQRPKLSSVGQLIGHKIHSPDIVRAARWPLHFPMHRRHVPPRPLSP
jgi:hypothetical protein